MPVYSLTAGLTQRDLERVTAAALDTLTGEWPDPLPELLRAKYRLPDAADALSAIHRPKPRPMWLRHADVWYSRSCFCSAAVCSS